MKGKILVVEDDEDLQNMYAEILESNEYQIETASDGEEGVEKFKEFDPKLVIMDSDMPKLNGYNATLKIKEIDSKATVVLITGYPKVAEGIKEEKRKEFVSIITKPIGMELLLDIAKKYCV